MTMRNRRELFKLIGATGLGGMTGFAGLANAQPLPQQPPAPQQPQQPHLQQARIVIGFPAGSGGDVACRLFAEKLKGSYAASVIVENKVGAAGRIGVDNVRTSPADGTSLLFTPTSVLTLYPHIYKTLTYDPFNDLLPLSRAATVTFALVVGSAVPAQIKDAKQFLQWCRANPSQATFGSPGAGSSPHFLGSTLAKASGAPLNHIPYKGTAAAVSDLIGGQIAALIVSPGNVAQYTRTGQARILAVTSPQRWELLPEVPTMTELGYPTVTNVEQFAFFIKRGTASAIVDRAVAAIRAAALQPDLVKAMAELDMKAEPSRPADLLKTLRTDHERWGEIVKAIGFNPQD